MFLLFVIAFMQANYTNYRAVMSNMSTAARMMMIHDAVVIGTIKTFNTIAGK